MTMKKIVIGTANFGMDYGIGHNQNKLIDSDIVEILKTAKKLGIDTIDTAISYGNSLNRLGELGIRNFKIITKFPKIPDDRKKQTNWFSDVFSIIVLMISGIIGISIGDTLYINSLKIIGTRKTLSFEAGLSFCSVPLHSILS